eukprot:scaffold95812_cov69-Phaeocystis_antarctica.AAC.3
MRHQAERVATPMAVAVRRVQAAEGVWPSRATTPASRRRCRLSSEQNTKNERYAAQYIQAHADQPTTGSPHVHVHVAARDARRVQRPRGSRLSKFQRGTWTGAVAVAAAAMRAP